MALIHQLLKFWDVNGTPIGSIAVDVDDSMLTTDPNGIGVLAYQSIGQITAIGPDRAAAFAVDGRQIGEMFLAGADGLNQTQLASRSRQAIGSVTLNSAPLDMAEIKRRA